MDTSSPAALVIVAVLALAVGLLAGRRVRPGADAPHVDARAAQATSQAVAPVKESLDRFDHRLRELEASRIEWHTQLREQVESNRLANEALRRETAALSTALRRPQVRGQWGEMHLKRTAELAGMVERCDFDVQVSVRDGDSLWRPDMVVRLAGGKQVVVDSKVPLDAFLDAGETDDPELRVQHLRRHARQLRQHIDALASKSYWRQFDQTPEFVVLFVPGESFLSQALDTEPTLLEHAAAQKVVLASPTTLIALLRTVAYAWTQEQLARNAREIHGLARELHDRIGTVGAHLDKLGRSLSGSVEQYNQAVGSFESRVLVTARRFTDLEVTHEPLESPAMIDKTPRPLTAAEFVDGLR